MKQKSKISVIVPVYNTEKYVEKCLDSILEQSYSNLQIIVVDDKSPGNIADIVKDYAKIDNRIVFVRNEVNKGLFHARLAGAQKADGDYIAFIDSDDYIGLDHFRCLVNAAEEHEADIVKSQFIIDNEKERYIYNYINNQPRRHLYGKDILFEYFKQEGRNFSLHTVWNKLYKKSLWDKCVPYYQRIKKHLIMTEDFAFSTILHTFANHYYEIDNETYFYLKRDDASTGIVSDIKKYEKNLSDLNISFDFINQFLLEEQVDSSIIEHFEAWKQLYARIWVDHIKSATFSSSKKKFLLNLIRDSLGIENLMSTEKVDHYFYSATTPWNGGLEDLKKRLAHKDVRYVSFDMFDTLVQRPFLKPTDLFFLLNKIYKEFCPKSSIRFSEVREKCEASLRKKNHGFKEEVTLDEIYQEIITKYRINREIAESLKNAEKSLEIHFCYERKTGKELLQLAHALGKKTFITSDIYLPRETIEAILKKSGITEYDEILISCELGKTKHFGSLYDFILKKYNVTNPASIFHIGDNWNSDIENAGKRKIQTGFLPKASEIFKDSLRHGHFFGGRSYGFIEHSWDSIINNSSSLDFFGIRCLLSIVGNKYHDNPYRAFNDNSDFNSDPYYMGYYALGMHLFGIVLDMLRKYNDKNKIHFVARDGYIAKQVYDIVAQYVPAPSSNYLYLSRKALMPALIQETTDFFSMNIHIPASALRCHSPESILTEYFHVSISEELQTYLAQSGVIIDKNFIDIGEFEHFLESISNKSIIMEEIYAYHKVIKDSFTDIIDENDVIFDIGYNGTAQMLISKMINKKVNAYYAYINKDKPYEYCEDFGFQIDTFYDYTPGVSGPVREFFFSETGPSCVGYSIGENGFMPLFEEVKPDYIASLIGESICQGSVDFARDVMSFFGNHVDQLRWRSYDVSLPFEFLMEKCKGMDSWAFHTCFFEDRTFLGEEKINLFDYWRKDIAHYGTQAPGLNPHHYYYFAPPWKKLAFLFLFDRKTMKEKVKARYQKKPILYNTMKLGYKISRKVGRLLVRSI